MSNRVQFGREEFVAAAKTVLNKVFIPDEAIPVIDYLCLYFSGNPDFTKQHPDFLVSEEPSLRKGIMITGFNGTGKTIYMEVFNRLSQFGFFPYFMMTDTRSVSAEIFKNGYPALNRFTLGDKLFNELGSEQPGSFYGTRLDPMLEIIFEREKMHSMKDQITHFTTNMSAKQLNDRYGDAVYSRLRGMCNIIKFPLTTDLRGKSHKINTMLNYADLGYRWDEYFGMIDRVRDAEFDAEGTAIMIGEIESRLEGAKNLYPGIFGPYINRVQTFLDEVKNPEILSKYTKNHKQDEKTNSQPSSDTNNAVPDGGESTIGDIIGKFFKK